MTTNTITPARKTFTITPDPEGADVTIVEFIDHDADPQVGGHTGAMYFYPGMELARDQLIADLTAEGYVDTDGPAAITTPAAYQETVQEIRTFIARCADGAAAQGDPVGVDVDALTPGEREAYHDGMAVAYRHVLTLLAPGRVQDETELAAYAMAEAAEGVAIIEAERAERIRETLADEAEDAAHHAARQVT